MLKTLFFLSSLFLCVFVPGLAQTRSDEAAVKITADLIQIDAVVTKNGKPITDLKAEDFEIFEDGRRRQISSFAYVAGRRTIALVVDDLGLSSQSMADVKRQLRKFIDEQLGPNDQIALVLTSDNEKLGPPQFVSDRSELQRKWERLVWNRCSRVGPRTNPNLNSSTDRECGPDAATAKDSLRAVRATVEGLGKVPGRKSMVLFSDNLPRPGDEPEISEDSLNKLTEIAMRSSVVMYAVDPGSFRVTSLNDHDTSKNHPPPYGAQEYKVDLYLRSGTIERRRKAARLMVEETGGFLVKDKNYFQLDDILEDQSGYYLIGYRPATDTFDKRLHTFKARVKKRGMTVRTRSGFLGISDEEVKRSKQISNQ